MLYVVPGVENFVRNSEMADNPPAASQWSGEVVSVNFVRPLLTTAQGNEYTLLFTVRFSRSAMI